MSSISSQDTAVMVLTTHDIPDPPLERILSHLSFKDLLRSQLVCTQWRDIASRSARLRQRLLLKPVSQVLTKVIPIEPDHKSYKRSGILTLEPHPCVERDFQTYDNRAWKCRILQSDWERFQTWPKGQWPFMFLTQPTTVSVKIVSVEGAPTEEIQLSSGVTVARLFEKIHKVLQGCVLDKYSMCDQELIIRGCLGSKSPARNVPKRSSPATDVVRAKQSTKKTVSSEKASVKVLRTYELVEHILSRLPMKDLLRSQLACKYWRDVIRRSLCLRQILFRAPRFQKITGVYKSDPKIRNMTRLVGTGSLELKPHPCIDFGFRTKDNVTWEARLSSEEVIRLIKYETDLKRVSLTQPITARVDIKPLDLCSRYIRRDGGVKVGELLDHMWRAFRESKAQDVSKWNPDVILRGYVQGTFSDDRSSGTSQVSSLTEPPLEDKPAARAVMTTYELVENILTFAPLAADEITRCMRVCRMWNTVIRRSKALYPHLHLRPAKGDTLFTIFKTRSYWSPNDWVVHPLLSDGSADFSFSSRLGYKFEFTITWPKYQRIFRECGKVPWPNMLTTQPPIQNVVVWSMDFKQGKYNHREKAYKARGIDFRALVQAIKRCMEEDKTLGYRGFRVRVL